MDYIQIISNVGFPIAAYMMMFFRLEKKLDKLIDTLERR